MPFRAQPLLPLLPLLLPPRPIWRRLSRTVFTSDALRVSRSQVAFSRLSQYSSVLERSSRAWLCAVERISAARAWAA